MGWGYTDSEYNEAETLQQVTRETVATSCRAGSGHLPREQAVTEQSCCF